MSDTFRFARSASASFGLSNTFRFVKDSEATLPPILSGTAALPPILSIEEISFSERVLDAEETAELSIRIKNVGPGPARDLTIELSGGLQGLTFPTFTPVPTIDKDGGEETVKIQIVGEHELPTATATIDIHVIEPHFKQKIRGKRLIFPTREFRNPELILAKFAVLESRSANPNNQIDINEMIDLKFYVQNVGQGDAEKVEVKVETNQIGVLWLGVATEAGLVRRHPTFSKIAAGKPELITYSYLVNSEFTEKELQFKITAKEKYGEYGFSETKSVAINTELVAEGRIRQVEIDDEPKGEIIIEELPELEIDVDKNIPQTSVSNPDAIAVVIGNQRYQHVGVPPVDFAVRDATVVKKYLMDTLGYKEGNILFELNATKGRFEAIFGTATEHRGLLYNYVKSGKSDVFIYYSGHGAPDPESKQGYFVPIDCDPAMVKLNGYPLSIFYNNLSQIPARSFTVVIDACFSGDSYGGQLLKNISPIFITVDNPLITLPNATIFTSATAEQVSAWYPDKKHSMFTYFFLKGLQGAADTDNDKKVTVLKPNKI
ncbi:MAG: caspase family protein [Candidatus Poribacteria bacterium]